MEYPAALKLSDDIQESSICYQIIFTNPKEFSTYFEQQFYLATALENLFQPLDEIVHGKIRLIIHQIEDVDRKTKTAKLYCRIADISQYNPHDKTYIKRKAINICIITLSDRAFRNEYADRSGPEIKKLLKEFYKSNPYRIEINSHLIPDNIELLRNLIHEESGLKKDIIITTGGTGLGPKDITIEAVKPLLDKEIPGIMELIRVKYGLINPNALISRSIAGSIKQSLIYTLPGSVKAVKEYISEILPTIKHSIFMLHQIDKHS